MSDQLEVAVRKESGKLRNRRMRLAGKLPAVLYGHGEETLSLSISAEQLESSLRHGAQVVDLKGDAKGQALLQDIQWDTFQQHILHVDLLRVDASDRVTVEIPLNLHGIAPGESEGGVVETLFHEIEIETSPSQIPEHLEVNINELHLGDALKVSDIEGLPSSAKVLLESDTTVVQCVEKTVEPEEDEVAEGGIEPEVIGKDGEESGGEDEEKSGD